MRCSPATDSAAVELRKLIRGGYARHALNRTSARATLFEQPADYQQFEQVLAEAKARTAMRIVACCLMPNHWHLVLWPEHDGALSRFMTWLGLTHTQRWHARRGSDPQSSHPLPD